MTADAEVALAEPEARVVATARAAAILMEGAVMVTVVSTVGMKAAASGWAEAALRAASAMATAELLVWVMMASWETVAVTRVACASPRARSSCTARLVLPRLIGCPPAPTPR